MIKGIDVSHYQSGIKWDQVKSDGNTFVFAKATDGLTADPTFQGFRKDAKAAGLWFGGYHFFRFDIDPKLQAQKLFHTVGDTTGELPYFLDVEWDRQSAKYHLGTVMDSAAADSVAVCFAELQKLFGNHVGIYTNYYFWNKGSHAYAGIPLWVPNYHSTSIAQVKIPAPWTTPAFWQYSESIKAYGVDAVDGNFFLGTEDQLKALVKQ